MEYGFRLPSALDNRPLKFEEWNKLPHREYLFQQHLENGKKKTSDNQVELLVRPTGLVDPQVEIKPATHQVEDVLEEAAATTAKGFQNINYNSHKKNGRGFNRLLIRKRFTRSIYAL